jgi:5'-AMP-activated protein kinase, regulatory gamma subunit
MDDLPKPWFMSKTPKELGIGTWGHIWTISYETPVIEALRLFLLRRISALPIVDSENNVVDIYSKFDVIYLAAGRAYNDLDVSVKQALQYREEWFEGVHHCSINDDLSTVVEAIVKAEVHRIIVTDENGRLAGIVSLSDILKFLVLDSSTILKNGFY